MASKTSTAEAVVLEGVEVAMLADSIQLLPRQKRTAGTKHPATRTAGTKHPATIRLGHWDVERLITGCDHASSRGGLFKMLFSFFFFLFVI